MQIKVQIGEFDSTYEVYETSAPKAYDYDVIEIASYEVEPGKLSRLILIESSHVEMQKGRNASGLHYTRSYDSGESFYYMTKREIIDVLFQRLYAGQD
jgi:hypothetical protein